MGPAREHRAGVAGALGRATRAGGALLLALVATCATLAANASPQREPLLDTPVYFPGTKSYFELVRATLADRELSGPGTPGLYIQWRIAHAKAQQRIHKGVRGRLALVKTPAVHKFLLETFRPDHITWIGLRYLCSVNRTQWVTGEFLERGEFAPWDSLWNRHGTIDSFTQGGPCRRDMPYWPVHYWGIDHGFGWNANGPVKDGRYYIVEYPTGKE